MKRIFVPTQSARDWQGLLAKPQLHWKKGASAMTLAACWEAANGGLPPEIVRAFRNSGVTELQDLTLLAAIPEYEVSLPGGSTTSHTDVLAIARNEAGLAVVAVEGKAEEPAGPTVGEKRAEASPGATRRLQYLHETLKLESAVADAIRYQFMHRAASAVLTAREFHASTAVMIVHSFSPSSTGYADFAAFCKELDVEAKTDILLRCPNIASPDLFVLWCPGEAGFREKDYLEGSKLNLFKGTRRLTDRKEDHLTEFFAAALALSPSFRADYCSLLLGTHATKNSWAKPEIVQIETQVPFNEGHENPDMVLRLADGRSIGVEHKIEAPETSGPNSDKPDQLRRYLDIEAIDAVAYVRASHIAMNADILENPKYIRPEGRQHFIWRDFYSLLEGQGGWFFEWVTSAFSGLGFRPPHAQLGDWKSERDRRNFAKFWDGTRHIAERTYDWKTSAGSIIELYLQSGSSPLAEAVWLNPEEFALLRIRVTPRPGRIDDVLAVLDAVRSRVPMQCAVEKVRVRRKDGLIWVVDVTASLVEVLGATAKSAEELDRRLTGFVEPFLRVLGGAREHRHD